jgi:hypothetical protein
MDQKIIALLLDGLHEDPNRLTADRLTALTLDEWRSLLSLAKAQNVSGLFYHRLKARGLEPALPQDIQPQLLEVYRQTAVNNLGLMRDLNRIVTLFQADGIPVIVLKGVYLASTVYNNLALREITDLDLLLPIDQIEQAAKLLKTLGYQQKSGHMLEVDMVFLHHLAGFTDSLLSMVELHWTITRPPSSYSIDPSIDPNELWARAVPVRIGDVEVLGLSAEDLLLHLCMHASYHHRFEFGLRPSCDIAETIRHFGNTLSWPQIVERARRWRWARGTYLALRLARELVGAAVPAETLRQLLPIPVDEAIVAAARGQIFTDRKLAYAISPKLARMRQSGRLFAKVSEVWHSVFLPRTEIAGLYAVSPHSRFFYRYYLIRLKDTLLKNSRLLISLWRRDPNLSPVAQRKAILLNWLSEK